MWAGFKSYFITTKLTAARASTIPCKVFITRNDLTKDSERADGAYMI